MTEPKFIHQPLRLVEPAFNSEVTDRIIELDYLRRKPLKGTTHPMVFFQLKHIFHTLESIGSARIEGNNTTLAEYIETKLSGNKTVPQSIRELQNVEKAMDFVESTIMGSAIDRAFISELHKLVVDGLRPPPDGEGDRTPGEFRRMNLNIRGSNHIPPDWIRVPDYMEEFFGFINRIDPSKYDLLKAAIAHHRFVWIHPFANGNGRTVRLLTYAMLVKAGFHVHKGRIINPTAVFCGNRNDYYTFLAEADKGTDEGILKWVEYVLSGLKVELEKIDKLLDYSYLKKEILLPAITHALERKYITHVEANMLRKTIEKQVIKAADFKEFFQGKTNAEVSRQIRKLLDKKMLIREQDSKRKYVLGFYHSYLLRSIFAILDQKKFLPIRDAV
ncbi:MAG: Fic family protein [Chitinophagales bacterium]|nr:Fic family protein [Chitinophagales bacterium]